MQRYRELLPSNSRDIARDSTDPGDSIFFNPHSHTSRSFLGSCDPVFFDLFNLY